MLTFTPREYVNIYRNITDQCLQIRTECINPLGSQDVTFAEYQRLAKRATNIFCGALDDALSDIQKESFSAVKQRYLFELVKYWTIFREECTNYFNAMIKKANDKSYKNMAFRELPLLYTPIINKIKSVKLKAIEAKAKPAMVKPLADIQRYFTVSSLSTDCISLCSDFLVCHTTGDEQSMEELKDRVLSNFEKLNRYQSKPLVLPSNLTKDVRDLQRNADSCMITSSIYLVTTCYMFESYLGVRLTYNPPSEYLAPIPDSDLQDYTLALARYHNEKHRSHSKKMEFHEAWQELTQLQHYMTSIVHYDVQLYFIMKQEFDEAKINLFVMILKDGLLANASHDFVSAYPLFSLALAILEKQSLLLKQEGTKQLYSEAKAMVEKLKLKHWQAIKRAKQSIKQVFPNVRLHSKSITSTRLEIHCERLNDPLFVRGIQIHQSKVLSPILHRLKSQYPFKVSINRQTKSISVHGIFNSPLILVQSFTQALLESHELYQKDSAESSSKLLPRLCAAVQDLSIKENSKGLCENEQSPAQKPLSGHHYKLLLEQKGKGKRKGKAKRKGKRNETILVDASRSEKKADLTHAERFGKVFKGLNIHPLHMLSCHHSKVYVVLLQDQAKKDECDISVRDKFRDLFVIAKQARSLNAQGFKYRKINDHLVLVAKILSNTGGRFRALPVLKVNGRDGSTLYVYHHITKKGSVSEKDYTLNTCSYENAHKEAIFKRFSPKRNRKKLSLR